MERIVFTYLSEGCRSHLASLASCHQCRDKADKLFASVRSFKLFNMFGCNESLGGLLERVARKIECLSFLLRLCFNH